MREDAGGTDLPKPDRMNRCRHGNALSPDAAPPSVNGHFRHGVVNVLVKW